jgi:antitoxin ParD1/3/4
MNVNLTPELERLVHEKVRSGLYNNQSEVVRDALRLLVEQDRLRETHHERLRKSLAEGLEQANRGELLDGKRVAQEMRAFLRKRRRQSPKKGKRSKKS